MIGVLILLFGIIAAIAVYWVGTHRAENADVDQYFYSQQRAQSRQMGILYGKMGTLIEDLRADLQQPGNQAMLIAAAAALSAIGCFYVARRFDEDI